MTELEKIEYTKTFIDKLANGINPIDNTPIPDNDIMNNVRLSRCMFYVSDILRRVIENGGTERPRRIEKVPFSLTSEQLAAYSFPEYPISVSEISKRIFALAENDAMTKLTHRNITSWLLSIGMLGETTNSQGKKKKYPTDNGKSLGISYERRIGAQGEYDVILYNKPAQQFILDNLEAIIAFNQK